jgi:Fe-S cluster biogenesis protein NfuA
MASLEEKIKAKIEELRPSLQADGGDLELIKIDQEGKKIHLRLLGACHGCPLSLRTMKEVVEKSLREIWPELQEVVRED